MKTKFETLDRDKWIAVDNSFQNIMDKKMLIRASIRSDNWYYYVSTVGNVFFYRQSK